MLKKLANNQMVMVLAAVVAIGAVYYYSQGFNLSLSGYANVNEAGKAATKGGKNKRRFKRPSNSMCGWRK